VNYDQLARKIQQRKPCQTSRDIARNCLMVLNTIDDLEALSRDEVLDSVMQDVELKFKAASDQHAAMTSELVQLAQSDPQKFSPDQIWILVRAIKVQSQVLRLFSGEVTAADTI
jgi:hypothetical protein